jgi:hypothetical protein
MGNKSTNNAGCLNLDAVLPNNELDPTITCAFFVGGNDKSCLDVVFDPDFTEKLFTYSIKRHLPYLLRDSV